MRDHIYRLLQLATLIVALIVGLVWVQPAAAEDMSSSYLVDMKVMKKGTYTDSLLTFELYGDYDCNTLLYIEDIPAGDGTLVFERLKLSKVKNGPMAPKPVRIRAVLDAPLLAPPVYLLVRGEGINPVISDCQM